MPSPSLISAVWGTQWQKPRDAHFSSPVCEDSTSLFKLALKGSSAGRNCQETNAGEKLDSRSVTHFGPLPAPKLLPLCSPDPHGMEGKDANQAGFPPGRRHLMEKRSTFKKKKVLSACICLWTRKRKDQFLRWKLPAWEVDTRTPNGPHMSSPVLCVLHTLAC
jgi:hypothetical protein